jgi:hypothetical protein
MDFSVRQQATVALSLQTRQDCLLGKRGIDRGQGVRGLDVIDCSNSQHRSQLIRRDFHRSGFWRGSWSWLREGRRHRSVKTYIPFHFLHHLMNMPVKYRH